MDPGPNIAACDKMEGIVPDVAAVFIIIRLGHIWVVPNRGCRGLDLPPCPCHRTVCSWRPKILNPLMFPWSDHTHDLQRRRPLHIGHWVDCGISHSELGDLVGRPPSDTGASHTEVGVHEQSPSDAMTWSTKRARIVAATTCLIAEAIRTNTIPVSLNKPCCLGGAGSSHQCCTVQHYRNFLQRN